MENTEKCPGSESQEQEALQIDEFTNDLIVSLQGEDKDIRRKLLSSLLGSLEKLKPLLFVDSPDNIICKLTDPQDLVRASKRIDGFVKDWIQSFRSNGCFYDVGSNVGTFGIYAAKTCGPDLSIYAFEFHYPTFATLCANILANDVAESVVPVHLALGKDSGVGTSYYRSLNSGSALHQLDSAVDFKGDLFEPDSRIQTCRASVDTLCGTWGFHPPDYIKIDTDGNEYDVILGARETFSRAKSMEVLVEFVHHSDAANRFENIVRVLKDCGFSLTERLPHKRIANLPVEDLFFTKR
ncbi:MAG: FkbM family methyltransferase [Terrimicrobiaceae bacterium]